MQGNDAISIRSPKRWDEPMDSSMSESDVAWLRSRSPFAQMDSGSFPRSMPLESILRYDCKLRRCEPGEIVVREGDYGNSAFLVLAGSVQVLVESLNTEQMGRNPEKKISWQEALRRYAKRSMTPEVRRPDQVSVAADASNRLGSVDDRQAIFLQDFDAVLKRNQTTTLGPGELFGEVAAMYRSPRTATVIADSEATLLEIRWQGLRVMRRDNNFSDRLENHYRSHWLKIHLREMPLLRFIPDDVLDKVTETAVLRSFGQLEWNSDYKNTRNLTVTEQLASEPIVVEEGRTPTELLIVRSGFGRMSRQFGTSHQTVAYLGKGHVFGLEEIATNATLDPGIPQQRIQHSLRAVGFMDTIGIPVEIFVSDVLPHVRRSELPQSVQGTLEQYHKEPTERRRGKREKKNGGADIKSKSGVQFAENDLLEFIVQKRLNNGLQAMVIDLHRCTRCDDCVKACAATHDGNPRFARTGQSHGRLQFVNACMQCADPVCMIGCPTGAIARDIESGVVSIHESICIGCGVCANSCPYENIRMAEIFDPQGRAYQDSKSGKAIKKATKCDMCSSQPSGPACAAACPHDALVRIDLTESHPLNEWLERRN